MHLDSRRIGASHTLDFHIAVTRFEKVCALNLPAALLAISQSIVGEFVMRRSPHAVAMEDESREVILAAHAKGAVPVALLHKEAAAIIDNLTHKDLPGFTLSSSFQELLSSLGAFSAELVASDTMCSAEHLVAFERMAHGARKQADSAASGGAPHSHKPPATGEDGERRSVRLSA